LWVTSKRESPRTGGIGANVINRTTSWVRNWAWGAGLLLGCFWSGTALAQGAPEGAGAREPVKTPESAPVNRPGVGLLAAAGLHSGFGLGARLGLGDLGVELTGGYQLLYAVTGSADNRKFDFGSSAQFGSELYYTPWHPTPKSAVGAKAGYRYNTVLDHGFGAAITFLATLSPHFAFEGLAGCQVFPGAEDRLRRKLDITRGDVAYGSNLQFFEYGFELIWYP